MLYWLGDKVLYWLGNQMLYELVKSVTMPNKLVFVVVYRRK